MMNDEQKGRSGGWERVRKEAAARAAVKQLNNDKPQFRSTYCKCEKMTLIGNVITFLTLFGGMIDGLFVCEASF